VAAILNHREFHRRDALLAHTDDSDLAVDAREDPLDDGAALIHQQCRAHTPRFKERDNGLRSGSHRFLVVAEAQVDVVLGHDSVGDAGLDCFEDAREGSLVIDRATCPEFGAIRPFDEFGAEGRAVPAFVARGDNVIVGQQEGRREGRPARPAVEQRVAGDDLAREGAVHCRIQFGQQRDEAVELSPVDRREVEAGDCRDAQQRAKSFDRCHWASLGAGDRAGQEAAPAAQSTTTEFGSSPSLALSFEPGKSSGSAVAGTGLPTTSW
jgi:hypothetical protein